MRVVLAIWLAFLMVACSDENTRQQAAPPATAPVNPGASDKTTETGLSAELMSQWTRNCALCHVRGEGGAPVLGDRQAWSERMSQGDDVLLSHVIEGINNMPPLGYCMDCEEGDFRLLIRFMAGEL